MAVPYRPSEFCEHCRPKVLAILAWIVQGGDEGPVEATTEPTTAPEDTLREAGVSSRRQARYQRRMSSLLAGRE